MLDYCLQSHCFTAIISTLLCNVIARQVAQTSLHITYSALCKSKTFRDILQKLWQKVKSSFLSGRILQCCHFFFFSNATESNSCPLTWDANICNISQSNVPLTSSKNRWVKSFGVQSKCQVAHACLSKLNYWTWYTKRALKVFLHLQAWVNLIIR